eukprot:1612-Eustigmatos_ZCMA.PRE.1
MHVDPVRDRRSTVEHESARTTSPNSANGVKRPGLRDRHNQVECNPRAHDSGGGCLIDGWATKQTPR